MKLTQPQTSALLWLDAHNGEGVLDRWGRVCAGGHTRPSPTWLAWLNLVALGLIAGSEGRLYLTRDGRDVAELARQAVTSRADTQTDDTVARKPNLDEIDNPGDEWESDGAW